MIEFRVHILLIRKLSNEGPHKKALHQVLVDITRFLGVIYYQVAWSQHKINLIQIMHRQRLSMYFFNR